MKGYEILIVLALICTLGYCIWFFSMLYRKLNNNESIQIKIRSIQTKYENNKQPLQKNKFVIKDKQKFDSRFLGLFIGLFFTVLGVIFLIFSLNMDTSVPTGFGEYVNNIGLMNEKQNYIIVSCFVILIGVLISFFLLFLLKDKKA